MLSSRCKNPSHVDHTEILSRGEESASEGARWFLPRGYLPARIRRAARRGRALAHPSQSYPIYRRGECMKRLLLFLVCLMLQVTLLAQDSKPATDVNAVADSQPTANTKAAASSDRMFFPKDWYWGWAQFDITPPHNETDPNLCAANAGQFGGVHSQCSAFGRYMISGCLLY